MFLRAARDIGLMEYVVVRLAAVTGMRRSELVALRRRHIRFDEAEITIEIGEIAIPGVHRSRRVETDTKTGHGGTLGLDAQTLSALAELFAEQDGLAAECGETVGSDGYILSSEVGCARGLHPDTLTNLATRLSKTLPHGVKIRLKDLRTYVGSAPMDLGAAAVMGASLRLTAFSCP